MSIKDDLGITELEEQLKEYNNQEDYERARGFDEQDEYLHLICSKQREIEDEINEVTDEYDKEIKQQAHKLVKEYIDNCFIGNLRSELQDYAYDWTDDDYELDHIVEESFTIINNIFYPPKTSIISLQYETKFSETDDLILVNQEEYEDNKFYEVDKSEILHFLIINTILASKKIAENCYQIKTKEDIFYIICPLSASAIIKEEYKEIINLLK